MLVSINDNFKNKLKSVIENLLKPENLVVKQVNKKKITASELRGFMDIYFKEFNKKSEVDAQSIYEMTVAMQLSMLIEKLISEYETKLRSTHDLRNHSSAKKAALNEFEASPKGGNKKQQMHFKSMLEEWIEKKIH